MTAARCALGHAYHSHLISCGSLLTARCRGLGQPTITPSDDLRLYSTRLNPTLATAARD